METVINFVYSGCLTLNKVDELPRLIEDLAFLGMDDLKEAALQFLTLHLNPSNAVDAYILSDKMDSTLLRENSKKIILENFERSAESEAFLSFDSDLIKEILSCDPMIHCTKEIFHGILRWIVKNPEERNPFLMEIFGSIQMSPEDIMMISKVSTESKMLINSTQRS